MPLADLLVLVHAGFSMETVPGPIPGVTVIRLLSPQGELLREVPFSNGCTHSDCEMAAHRADPAAPAAADPRGHRG